MSAQHHRFEHTIQWLERLPIFRLLERGIQKGAEPIAPFIVWFAYHREYRRAKSDATPRPSDTWVRNQHNAVGRLTVTVFMIFLSVMTVLAFCLPLRPNWSELEQRNLTKFPTPSVKTVLNGAYFDGINTWFADTFPFREVFLTIGSEIEELYGFRGKNIVGHVTEGDEIPDTPAQLPVDSSDVAEESSSASLSAEASVDSDQSTETNNTSTTASTTEKSDSPKEEVDEEEDVGNYETLGALLVRGDTAYEYYNFSQERADQYSSVLNKVGKALKGKANVYDMVVPTSMDICVSEKTRKSINTSDQRAAIQYMYGSMSDQVHTVDVFDILQGYQDQGEYLYFRTDHHWTAQGAYRAYQAFAEAAGVKVADLKEDFTEQIFEGFTGSFYRELMSSTLASNPDTIYAYTPKDVSTATITWSDGTISDYDIVHDVSDYSATQKYSTFIGSDNPFTVIKNPKITDGSSVLLIKESFGNCFAPFLAESYQTVYVVDYRYFKEVDNRKLQQVVSDYHIQDVLFLNNISATRGAAVDQIESFAGVS